MNSPKDNRCGRKLSAEVQRQALMLDSGYKNDAGAITTQYRTVR